MVVCFGGLVVPGSVTGIRECTEDFSVNVACGDIFDCWVVSERG